MDLWKLTDMPYVPALPLLGIHPKETESPPFGDISVTHSRNIWKEIKSVLFGIYMMKLYYIDVEHCSLLF